MHTIRRMALLLIAAGALSAQQPDLVGLAARLPQLEQRDGKISLPLRTTESPYRWRAIDRTVSVTEGDGGLTVRYVITPNKPAGVALLVPPGTFRDLARLQIHARSDQRAEIVATLRDATGVVFAFPAVTLLAGKDVRVTLSAEELSYFPDQSTAPEPASFDPAGAILLTLVDVSGFTGESIGRETSWSISSIEGEVR